MEVKHPERGTPSLVGAAPRFGAPTADRHLAKAMQTIDNFPERFGTIEQSVHNTERLYSVMSKGTGRH